MLARHFGIGATRMLEPYISLLAPPVCPHAAVATALFLGGRPRRSQTARTWNGTNTVRRMILTSRQRVLNGFAVLSLKGPNIQETFYDENGGVAWKSV